MVGARDGDVNRSRRFSRAISKCNCTPISESREENSNLSLLYEIQKSVVQQDADLSSVLLKLRLLASRLGSDVLEEWVKHESEGYPMEIAVPAYRIIPVTYTGTFSGPGGASIRNAPIPSYVIEKMAGESWVQFQVRESIGAIADLLRSTNEGNHAGIDSSNLILLLQGKVYAGYACNSINGALSGPSLGEILHSVRGRILELTLELEKSIPAATLVTFGAPPAGDTQSDKVQQISQQIIYGNVETAVGIHGSSSVHVSVNRGDKESVISYLESFGIPNEDASEFASLIESEKPSSEVEPFGKKAKQWLAANLEKAAKGTWNVGISVSARVLSEAALKYYGLK